MKRCTKCGRELPDEEFYMRRGKRAARCKDCMKDYQKKNYKRKKREKKKTNGSRRCERCVYRTYIGESEQEIACYYIEHTGHRRGCPVENCDKYVEGDALTKRSKPLRF